MKSLFRVWRVLARYTQGPFDAPINLAVFRVVLFGYVAWFAAYEYDLVWFAGLPDAFRIPPVYTAWYTALPLSADVVAVGRVVLIAAALAACVGWYTRIATAVAAVAALVILGVPQLYGGKVDHYHHLVWFAALLAASPCGDTMSVDAWRRRSGNNTPSRPYALPLQCVWLLLGLIYFFPGLAKAQALPAWVSPDNLRYQLYASWASLEHFTPLVPIDQWPVALSASAAATIGFELTAVGLLMFDRTRWVGVAGGLMFHFMTRSFMAIDFVALQICYVAFLRWDLIADRLGLQSSPWFGQGGATEATVKPLTAIRIVAAVLIVATLYTGYRRIDSWPFANYPRFDYIAGHTMTTTEILLFDANGSPVELRRETLNRVKAKMKPARWSRVLQRGIFLDQRQRERWVRAVLAVLSAEDSGLRLAAGVDVFRVTRELDPAARGNAADRKWIARIAIGDGSSH